MNNSDLIVFACQCLQTLGWTVKGTQWHYTLNISIQKGFYIFSWRYIPYIHSIYICNNAFTNVKRTRFKPCRQLVLQRLLFSRDIPRSQTQTLQHYLHTWYSHPFASSYFRFVFVTLVRIWVSPMSIQRTWMSFNTTWQRSSSCPLRIEVKGLATCTSVLVVISLTRRFEFSP